MLYAFDRNWPLPIEQKHCSVNGLCGLKPGDVLVYDFRGAYIPEPSRGPLRVVQWNIERGYKLDGVIQELRTLDADVILLQELDISCKRSDYRNVPLEIAKALNSLCAFVCEFHELPGPPERSEHNASGCDYGFHGNAIVTRTHLLHSLRAFKHSRGLDWDSEGNVRKEPRVGSRYVLTGCIDSYGENNPFTGELPATGETLQTCLVRTQLYSLHLEIFCGPLMRLQQLSDAIEDAHQARRRFYKEESSAESAFSPLQTLKINTQEEKNSLNEGCSANQRLYVIPDVCSSTLISHQRHFTVILGGDFNTIMHGIVRFSGLYSDDRTRLLSFGKSEAEWLQRTVFSYGRTCSREQKELPTLPSPANGNEDLIGRDLPWGKWFRTMLSRWRYGALVEQRARQLNEELQLYDAFDKTRDITLDNPAYRGFVTGKLDWLLLSNLFVESKKIGPDWSLSDHKYLMNTLRFPSSTTSNGQK